MERSGIYIISLFVNFLSVFVLEQRIFKYYPNHPTHRLYFGEVETHNYSIQIEWNRAFRFVCNEFNNYSCKGT